MENLINEKLYDFEKKEYGKWFFMLRTELRLGLYLLDIFGMGECSWELSDKGLGSISAVNK